MAREERVPCSGSRVGCAYTRILADVMQIAGSCEKALVYAARSRSASTDYAGLVAALSSVCLILPASDWPVLIFAHLYLGSHEFSHETSDLARVGNDEGVEEGHATIPDDLDVDDSRGAAGLDDPAAT